MTTPTADKMPPHDVEAEECVLGSILIDTSALNRVRAVIKPKDFYIVKNQWVFEAMLDLKSSNQPIDAVTLRRELGVNGKLDEIGGPAFITYLMTVVPTAIHAAGYASIVSRLAVDRRILTNASDMAQLAYDGEKQPGEKLSALYEMVRELSVSSGRSNPIRTSATELLDDVEAWAESPIGPDDVRGISLGIRALDKLTGGLHDDDLTILTARPGIGKTALALQIADTLAARGKRILFYSLEMRAKRVNRRLASRRAKVNFQQIERGRADADDLAKIMRALGEIADLPIVVNDDNHITSSHIMAEADQLRPDLIVIDNLNIMLEPQAYANENDVKRIGRASRNLKIIANDLHIPVLCICHLNRQTESRANKRPQLSDLRDSGEIEQNADNVLGMYRDMGGDEQSANIVEVWPLKLRDGDTSSPAKFIYNGAIYEFVPAETRPISL